MKKRWNLVSEEESNAIKEEKCSKCKYAGYLDVSVGNRCMYNISCDYLLITKQRRGCRPEECDKFEKKG